MLTTLISDDDGIVIIDGCYFPKKGKRFRRSSAAKLWRSNTVDQ
jgi:hypothetical protein